MKIEKTGNIKVSEVKEGEVFELRGAIYIKTYSFADSKQHYFRLNDGFECNINEDEDVIAYPDAKIVLE